MADEPKPKTKMHIDAEPISKLIKEPVEVKVGVYELDAENEKMVRVEDVQAWLHRITWEERTYVRAACAEMYRFLKNQDESKTVISQAVEMVIARMTVFFSLKKGNEAKSERFFPSREVIMEYPVEESIYELHREYHKQFSLNETEWGNWLRARSLKVSSDLPKPLEGEPLLDGNSPSSEPSK